MARRRRRGGAGAIDLPWWVAVFLAAGSWVGIVYFLPEVLAGLPIGGRRLAVFADRLAWAPATLLAAVLLLWASVLWRRGTRKKRLLDTRTGIASIRALSWREFEELVAEAFRREGYRVVENTKAGADGGVDIRLRKEGRLVLVQCKHWNSNKVGVPVVREMCGVMMDQHAAGVVIVCSGGFTRDAWAFAKDKAVRLVDGRALMGMIARVKE